MSADRQDSPDHPPLTRPRLLATALFYVVAVGFFGYLSYYYLGRLGGPTQLAVAMVPVAIALVFLNDARYGRLYPALGPWGGVIAASLYLGILLYCAYYLNVEFDAIRIFRVGFWNAHDMWVGGTVAAAVLEYIRRKYLPVFVINVLLIVYTLYGHHIPGMFSHTGFTWQRVVSAASLEISTGVFERLSQLGLTLIGSFILVLSALKAFNCIDSILRGSSRLAARMPRLLPQVAVLGSFGVAAVSGSGAANAATTGTATIPALIRAGLPRVKAAAIETASSLGGQLTPPLMGIAAFMMADLMGVSYFDVVARGFVPALIFFIGVAFSVHLLSARYFKYRVVPEVEPMGLLDWVNIAAYVLSVAALIYYMGVLRQSPMNAAQTIFIGLLLGLSVLFFIQCLRERQRRVSLWLAPFRRLIETFATTTSELVVLLAALGILTAMFTITGVPTKVGVLVLEMAQVNLVLMVLVAFAFGYLVGMGLPVAPTYIILAVVIAPFMIRAGFNPWVVHFFAFFVAVFGELSPPTSVTAAVTSRIAEAPFVATMIHAMGLCIPLILMIGAVFTRPELVIEPGAAQLTAMVIVLVATLAMSFALQGRWASRVGLDRLLRFILAALALVALFYPTQSVALGVTAVVAVALAVGLVRGGRLPELRDPVQRQPQQP